MKLYSGQENTSLQNQLTNHPLQTIMSRTGSFPLRVASNLLERYKKGTRSVFDPFCGKGTTLLAARMLGLPAYGMDIAPEAVICTSAKMADVCLEGLLAYVKSLSVHKVSVAGIPESVRFFFHPETLAQIISIRNKLIKDIQSDNKRQCSNATFTLASLLGILHGHASFSLSISSAHAYAMSPSYVMNYAAKHGLKPPLRDVKACLAEKISRCLRMGLPKPVKTIVRRGSALQCSSVFPELVGKVDVILTSPPYLNAQTYAKDNWLRLWLVGHDYKELQSGYLQTGSIDSYRQYMERVFIEMATVLKPGGRLICIAGDVRVPYRRGGTRENKTFETGTFLAKICKLESIRLEVQQKEKHTVRSTSRYLHALSNSNGHSKSDLLERVFVAVKV